MHTAMLQHIYSAIAGALIGAATTFWAHRRQVARVLCELLSQNPRTTDSLDAAISVWRASGIGVPVRVGKVLAKYVPPLVAAVVESAPATVPLQVTVQPTTPQPTTPQPTATPTPAELLPQGEVPSHAEVQP